MRKLSDEDIKWETPDEPRKIDDILPYEKETITETAIIGQDKRNQYFIRIPRKIAESLKIKKGNVMLFKVTTPLPKPKTTDEIKLDCEIIRT